MLDKTLIKTRTKQVPAIDFMKNIFYYYVKNIVIIKTMQTKNENTPIYRKRLRNVPRDLERV